MKLWLTRERDEDGSEFKSFWTAKPEYSLGRWRGPRDERVQVPLQALEALPWPDEVGPKGIREVELVWPGAVLQGPPSVSPATGFVVKLRKVKDSMGWVWGFSGTCPTVALEDALKLLLEGVTGGWESMRRYARGSP